MLRFIYLILMLAKVFGDLGDGSDAVENQLVHCDHHDDMPLTQLQFFKDLTNPRRYDRIQPPENFDDNGNLIPVNVYIRSYVFYLQNLDTHDLQFKMQLRFQIRYKDPRLEFAKVGSDKTDPITGEEDLKKDIWMPHLYIVNEKHTGILGTHSKDVLTSIFPDGTVIVSLRFQVTLYCSMDFRKFPFDQQECKTTISNWKMKASEVKLHWEDKEPFVLGSDKILTEYLVVGTSLNETEITAATPGFEYGDFLGTYSILTFKITFKRHVGYYLLDYYFPSMLIIAASWVSFWLQADQTPARTTLGITSMLTFITLSTSQTNALPKVSYIKASEIWFIVGTLFIFASLVEFAFSNLVWRRRKLLQFKKLSTKHLLKKTIRPRRKTSKTEMVKVTPEKDISITVFSPIMTQSEKLSYGEKTQPNNLYIPDMMPEENDHSGSDQSYQRERLLLTHNQVSILLDKRARIAFPVAFLIFNIFYWLFVNV